MNWFAILFILPATAFCSFFGKPHESDYDEFLKILLGPESTYAAASYEIQSEIETIHKYFSIERQFRYELEFSKDTFYAMIQSDSNGIFADPDVCELIKFHNKEKLKMKLIFLGNDSDRLVKSYNTPHFPELELELFKAELDSEKRKILVKNAMSFPVLYLKFFKYLSTEHFKVNRYRLHLLTNPSDPQNSVIFKKYQAFQENVHIYISAERSILTFATLILPFFFSSTPWGVVLLIAASILPISGLSFFGFFLLGQENYSNFENISSFQSARYHLLTPIVCVIYKPLAFTQLLFSILFLEAVGWSPEYCNEILRNFYENYFKRIFKH